MSYYHVRLVKKEDLVDRVSDGPRVYETIFDLSREELEERILSPYRLGHSITLRGISIPAKSLGRVLISKSNEESRILRALVEAETGSSYYLLEWLTADRAEDVTDKLITGPPGDKLITGPPGTDDTGDPHGSDSPLSPADSRNVFVVHGRNAAARDALFEFLRSIDLRPLEWSEAVQITGKTSPYIGDVLDAAFSRAHAVVVLLTPDDEAHLRREYWTPSDPPHETEPTGQARPNVLFEAGMAMGRNQDRTILVELGVLRPFSDVAGRHAIRLDNSSQRRQELAQRLKSAGCPVNLDGTDWHSAGEFSLGVEGGRIPR